MNLPEFLRAHERAWDSYDKACTVAREELGKSLAAAREQFFEDARQEKAETSKLPRDY